MSPAKRPFFSQFVYSKQQEVPGTPAGRPLFVPAGCPRDTRPVSRGFFLISCAFFFPDKSRKRNSKQFLSKNSLNPLKNPPEFAQPRLSRVKAQSSPARGYKFGCVCSFWAGHCPSILMTGHIGTNTPKFVPPRGGRPRFDPTQTGLCKFGCGFGACRNSKKSPNHCVPLVAPLQLAPTLSHGNPSLSSNVPSALACHVWSLRGAGLQSQEQSAAPISSSCCYRRR